MFEQIIQQDSEMEEGERQQVGIFITVPENTTVKKEMLNEEIKKLLKERKKKI